MEVKAYKKSDELKKIFSISWPVMLSIVLQNLLGTVDMIFIGHLGKPQLAAAAMANSVSSVIFVLATLISSGTVALVTRSYGAKDMEAVKEFNGVSILLSLVIGGVLSCISFIYTKPIVKIMFHPSKEILTYTNQYLSILFLGTVLVFLNSTLRTTIQSLGDTLNPLIIFAISNVINAILSPLFIFVFKMGIRGSAFAAVIAMIFSCIAINSLLIKKLYDNNFKAFLQGLRFNYKTSSRILKIGSWSCLQSVARPITGLFMFSLVFSVGKGSAVAAFGVGGNLFSYTTIILSGLSTGVAIMVGQSLGRKDYDGCDNIIKEGIKLAVINMIVFIIPYILFPGALMKIFTHDTEVVKVGVDYLRIVYCGLLFIIFPTIYGGVFQGSGDTFPSFISSFVANVVLKLPLAYFLAIFLKLGTNGVWIAVAMSVVIEAIFIIVFFKQNKWKAKVV